MTTTESLKGTEVMVTSDLFDDFEYDTRGTVVAETEDFIYVRFPGRFKPVEIDRHSGKYEPLGRRGMEPGEE